MSANPACRRIEVLGAILVVIVTGSACPKAPVFSPLTRQAENVDMPAEELRARIYQFTDRFAGVVEEAADEIIRNADDRAFSHRALQWKVGAIPASQRAAFQPDPFAAGIDLWVLTAQMEQFFVEGAGAALFGPQQGIAVEASQQLLAEMVELVRGVSLTDDISRGADFVEGWVENHPIESLLFSRISTRPVLVRLVSDRRKGAFAAVGGMADEVSDLNDRLAVYGETLPKQARWQAELFYDHVAAGEELDLLMRELASISSSASTIAELVESLDEPMDERLDAVLELLQAERDHLLGDVDRQRNETIVALQSEREIVLAGIERERELTLAALRQERIEIMEALEALTLRTMDDSTDRVEQLADRLFWHFAALAGALVAFLTLGGLLAIRAIRS